MKNTITYTPSGVCSTRITIVVENDIIHSAAFTNGCHGNGQGLAALLQGMTIGEAITRLRGIDCSGRGTSCPDQLALALSDYAKQHNLPLPNK